MSFSDFLKQHQISKKFGFVLEDPVSDLDESKFGEWKSLCNQITNGSTFESVSRTLETIGKFDVKALKSHEEQRYAKLLLETIVQGYLFMHINAYTGDDFSKVPDRLPPSLARPVLEISELLGMNPVISHASVTLANVKLKEGKEYSEFLAENLAVIMPRPYMEGADIDSYNWFFQIEASFARTIRSIAYVCYHINNGDTTVDLGKSLSAITENCEKARIGFKKYRLNLIPRVFFCEIRPCLWGYDQLPNGLKFGDSKEPVKYRGASASESTSMQVVDAFLDVKFLPAQKGFIVANRAFMPAGHREFIQYVEKTVAKDDNALSLRVRDHPLYPSAMRALKDLRSEHINLVTMFVATQLKNTNDAPVSPGKMLIGFLKSFRDACIVSGEADVNSNYP